MAPCCQERNILGALEPMCLPLCVLCLGWEGGECRTHSPGEAGILGAALHVCACIVGFRWVLGKSSAHRSLK